MLSPGGPVARELGDDFEPRPQQARMAEGVERAMRSGSSLMVEAGTGVGKSFAYLLPAVRRIVETAHGPNPERVVVATNTIALQEQLLNKDVPLLQRVFLTRGADGQPSPGFRAELVKGRGNYLSIRRLEMASQREDRLFPDHASRDAMEEIRRWAYETLDGTLATLPQLTRPAVWDRVNSDAGNCMGRRCPRYQACFFQSARRRMENADLLICNHALFFSDLALRARGAALLPTYHHVILDEAHAAEDVASEHFGVSLSESRVAHLLSMLHSPSKGRGLLASLRSCEAVSRDEAERLTMAADDTARLFFERVVALAGGRPGSVRLPAVAPGADPPIENTLSPVFRELALSLRRLKDATSADDEKHEINAYAERAQDVALQADILCRQAHDGYVYWAEASTGSRGFGVRGTLACAPVEVGPILREHLFSGKFSVVLTSATLTTSHAEFSHASERLGCPDAETLALGSPFDHARQVELHADASMPDPRAPDYIAELASRIISHVTATDGGAFVLFTSFDTMHRAADATRPALESLGMPVWVQGKDGSREHILSQFRASEQGVLFGTSSFWQGVDVRGRALRNVIITRLPFEPPDRPLTQARLELIRSRGGNPFLEDSLPRAVLRFKQGFGRLVRSATDTGRVVVLDPRLLTARYGTLFLGALPEGVRVIR